MRKLVAHGCEIRDEDSNLIAQTYGGDNYQHCTDLTYKQAAGMAKRMAAVDEMYRALQGLLDAHRHVYGLDGAWDSEVKAAEAALAKVDGG